MNLSAFPARHICAVYFLCISDNGHSCIGDICYGSGTAALLHCSFIVVMDGQPRLFVWAEQKKRKKKKNARNKRLHQDHRGAEWQKKQVYLLRGGHIMPICCNRGLKCASALGFNGITGFIYIYKKLLWNRTSDDKWSNMRGWIIKHQAMAIGIKWVLHTQPLILYICP